MLCAFCQKMLDKKILEPAGLFILRLGIGIVFLSFGIGKLLHPTEWVLFIPSWLTDLLSHQQRITVHVFLHIQGIVEAVIGFQLILGILTRLTACVASLVLFLIVYSIGFDPIGIRDTGLLFSSIVILILGPGEWSMDVWFKKYLK